MIKGKSITLRSAKSEEKRLIYDMGLSTDYLKQSFAETFENGFESFNDNYVEEYYDGNEPYVRGGMMICLDDNPIGFISYGQICDFCDRDWIYHFGTMELDIWMDGEKNCGKGYGVDALMTLTDYLHEKYNIDMFMICPERINPRAVHSYGKAGFKEVPPVGKRKILLEIFGQNGLNMLNSDDDYFSDDSCFMIKRY